jgi:hypothetical protein
MAQAPPPPPPPGYGAPTGVRPPAVGAASGILFATGGLRLILALITLLVLIGASGQLAGFGVGGGQIAFAYILVLVTLTVGALQIVAGTNTRKLRARGRTLGMVVSIVGILLGLLNLMGGFGGAALGILLGVLLLIGDIVIVILLAPNSRYYTA